MQVLHGFNNLPTFHHPVATVGSYDGVHCGHRIIIDEVVRRAKAIGGESILLTFEPHPRITLQQDGGLRLLTTLEEKAQLLESCDVDYLLVIPFDIAFSRLSHEEFISDYITGRLGIEELVIGYNHHFGHNKSGNYAYLSEKGGTLRVTEVKQHLVDEQKVSSTIIRQTIERGDMTLAAQLTGHPYIIIGMANENGFVVTDRYKLLPPQGIYQATINDLPYKVVVSGQGIELGRAFAFTKSIIRL
ncbi:MAG: FAD synthetase [Alistipes sp.]|nr:FAD synthetase [Alistipes sp.]